ncbi:hypothetical protein MRX96_047532 [Rhipicephalus microplus]
MTLSNKSRTAGIETAIRVGSEKGEARNERDPAVRLARRTSLSGLLFLGPNERARWRRHRGAQKRKATSDSSCAFKERQTTERAAEEGPFMNASEPPPQRRPSANIGAMLRNSDRL